MPNKKASPTVGRPKGRQMIVTNRQNRLAAKLTDAVAPAQGIGYWHSTTKLYASGRGNQ